MVVEQHIHVALSVADRRDLLEASYLGDKVL